MPDEDAVVASENPWTVLTKRVAYDNRWIQVIEHDVLNPSGNPGLYGVVHVKSLAVGVLPLDDDGFTFLVGQHRFPGDYFSWELPEGGGAMDEPAEVSGARELREETGLKATCWHRFLRMDLSNAISDEMAVGLIAWDLEQFAPEPEEDEKIIVRRVRFGEALEMAISGEIVDSFAQTMLFKARLLADRRALPNPVLERLSAGM
jgi:8-oxo-dGTP pyrophosphatase MutT (NUDIX family)